MPAIADNEIARLSAGEGLRFILSHFQEPIWPRTIMTPATRGQLSVTNDIEAFHYFRRADLIDCRISAYPQYVEYKGMNRQAPVFFMIDLDRHQFKSDDLLRKALAVCLKNIKDMLEGYPTVLFTGHGYHIYQPLQGFILEDNEKLAKLKRDVDLSTEFMRFAAGLLSNGKHDPANTQSLRNCMLRVPGSYNSKCISKGTEARVRVIQRWNGKRPEINYLFGDFYAYLIDKKYQQSSKPVARAGTRSDVHSIYWIDRLLETGIADYRKYAISLIVVPYLLNIQHLPEDKIAETVKKWLEKCAAQRPLDFNARYAVKYAVRSARKGYKPMKLETLKERNPTLYTFILP